MIPEQLLDITELEETQYATQTYRLDLNAKRIGGLIDDKEAMLQAIIKIITTERYSTVIYDGDYGIEKETLIGQDFDYVISELPRRITEALMVDDRIIDVTDFEYTKDKDTLTASIVVNTIYGELSVTTEVAI